jgi:hypothetical protein
MKTVVLSMFLLACVAGNAWSQNCAWPCNASYRCGSNNLPETPTCAAEDSCLSFIGDDFTLMRFNVPEAYLESRSQATGSFLTSLSRVFDSIRAHGGSGAAVDLHLELDVTLERFEPGSPSWAHAAAQIEVPSYGGIGVTTVGSGRPGQQVDHRTLRMTRPIVPGGAPLEVEWFVESGASGGGTSSASGRWQAFTLDPTVALEHCRDVPVPVRTTSWGAVKSIYRGASTQ